MNIQAVHLCIQQVIGTMKKQKSIDYILGMITGASLMLAFWACTSNELVAYSSDVQEVKVVNQSWDPVYVESVSN